LLTEVSGNAYNKNFSTTLTVDSNKAPGNYTINLVAETANGRSSTTFTVTVTVAASPG
jgi:PKD repeat protein